MARTRWPVDLVGVALATAAAVTAILLDAPIPVKALFGLPLALVLPGYAILTVTHPGVGEDRPDRKRVRSLANVDRAILSVSLSVIVALLVGATLAFIPVGLTPASAALAVGGVTLLATLLGLAVRLADTPPDRRPSFGWRSRRVPWHESLSLLALAIGVIAVAVAGARFAGSIAEDGYVSMFTDPNFVVECYPIEHAGGNYSYAEEGGARCNDPASNLTLVINNHRDEAVDYTLRILWSQQPDPEAPGGELMLEARGRLDPLPDSDRLSRQHTQPLLTEPPPFAGLQYLKVQLFLGPTPGDVPDHALQLRVVRE